MINKKEKEIKETYEEKNTFKHVTHARYGCIARWLR